MCSCVSSKKQLDIIEYTSIHSMIKENNPIIRERRLSVAEEQLLELSNNKDKYDKVSRDRISYLIEQALKKRKFIKAWYRKNRKKYPSSHI